MNEVAELAAFYESAKSHVIERGYSAEIDWTKRLVPNEVTEQGFLREAAWVVLCSGFRESVVRKKFSYISLCFCDWESCEEIVRKGDLCVETALHAFGNVRKLSAILEIAKLVLSTGYDELCAEISRDPLSTLSRFPFIGEITAQHLAKNLGYVFAKDDRHLNWLAKQLGYVNAQVLCHDISRLSGDTIPVVDSILWRSAALRTIKDDLKLVSLR